jgi:hypothetical protein
MMLPDCCACLGGRPKVYDPIGGFADVEARVECMKCGCAAHGDLNGTTLAIERWNRIQKALRAGMYGVKP